MTKVLSSAAAKCEIVDGHCGLGFTSGGHQEPPQKGVASGACNLATRVIADRDVPCRGFVVETALD